MNFYTFKNGTLTAGLRVTAREDSALLADFQSVGSNIELGAVLASYRKNNSRNEFADRCEPPLFLRLRQSQPSDGSAGVLIHFRRPIESLMTIGCVSLDFGMDQENEVWELVVIPEGASLSFQRYEDGLSRTVYEIQNYYGNLLVRRTAIEGDWAEIDGYLYSRLDGQAMLRIRPDNKSTCSIESDLYLLSSGGWEYIGKRYRSVDFESVKGNTGRDEQLLDALCAKRVLAAELMSFAALLYPGRLSHPSEPVKTVALG
jgi:hypothetical protein